MSYRNPTSALCVSIPAELRLVPIALGQPVGGVGREHAVKVLSGAEGAPLRACVHAVAANRQSGVLRPATARCTNVFPPATVEVHAVAAVGVHADVKVLVVVTVRIGIDNLSVLTAVAWAKSVTTFVAVFE